MALLRILTLSLFGSLAAQEPLVLREIGRTTAVGGEVQRCAFDQSGTHLLSVGDAGDLVYWDVASLTPRLRIPPLARYVTALALHPQQPWALVGVTTSNAEHGRVAVLDLVDGSVRPLWSRYVACAAFDAAGERLALGLAEPDALRIEVRSLREGRLDPDAEPTFVARIKNPGSPQLAFDPSGRALLVTPVPTYRPDTTHEWISLDDGAHETRPGSIVAFGPDGDPRVATRGANACSTSDDGGTSCVLAEGQIVTKVERLAPEPATWECRDSLDSWVQRVFAASGGTIAATDVQGQIHVLGPEPERHRVASANLGIATGLTWTPDGRYVAVQCMGALRIVDRSGTVVADRPGTPTVAPGPVGPELWIADATGIERWNAAAARSVGDRVPWSGGRPRLLTGNPHHGLGALGSTTLYRPAPFVPLPHGALIGSGRVDGVRAPQLLAHEDGTLRVAPRAEIADAYAQVELGGGVWDPVRGQALVIGFTTPGRCGIGMAESTLFGAVRAYVPGDDVALARGFKASVWWLVPSVDASAFLVGTSDGTVHTLDPESLSSRTESRVEPALEWLLPIDADRALAADGQGLWIVDLRASPLRKQELTGLRDFGSADLAALAPDRRHVVLASGSDVRIAVIE